MVEYQDYWMVEYQGHWMVEYQGHWMVEYQGHWMLQGNLNNVVKQHITYHVVKFNIIQARRKQN